jgi:hypothetical protein
LREEPAERVADDDRRLVEPADELFVVIDALLDPEAFERRRVPTHLFGIADPRPTRRDRAVAAI